MQACRKDTLCRSREEAETALASHRHSESAQKLAVSSDTSSSIFFWLLYLPLGSSSLFFTQFQAQCLLVVANETLLAAPATAIPKPAVFGDFHAAGDTPANHQPRLPKSSPSAGEDPRVCRIPDGTLCRARPRSKVGPLRSGEKESLDA